MSVNVFRYFNKNFNRFSIRKLSDFSSYLQKCSTSNAEIVYNTENPSFAFIGLNRPKSKNAIGNVLMSDLKTAVLSVNNSKNIRSVVIGSLVPNIFCAGADLKERKNVLESDVEGLVKSVREFFQFLAEIPVPTICAIDGPAMGGGLELALSCDLRYAAENSFMGLTETKLAIIPGAGGTQRLSRLVGIAKAKELIFTGETITGKEALEIGLVNGIVKQNSSGNAALLEAFSVAEKISENGPIGVKMAKAAIDGGIQMTSIKDALLVEEKFYAKVIPTSDRMEALNAFQEKRKPKYEGK